ncbi:MAG: hypothetical protein V7K21_29100 [Nostoc sp.]|uniref:hypothetical protein n=1 Tax=Nostoc sp. TaxID=1180 RepID=UPI002FF4E3E1
MPVVDIAFPLVGNFRLVSTVKKISCIVGGSVKRLKKPETLASKGRSGFIYRFLGKQAKNFCTYLERHRLTIVNYCYGTS